MGRALQPHALSGRESYFIGCRHEDTIASSSNKRPDHARILDGVAKSQPPLEAHCLKRQPALRRRCETRLPAPALWRGERRMGWAGHEPGDRKGVHQIAEIPIRSWRSTIFCQNMLKVDRECRNVRKVEKWLHQRNMMFLPDFLIPKWGLGLKCPCQVRSQICI